MTLEIVRFILGPLDNNCYLIVNHETMKGVVIDPSFGSDEVIALASEKGWNVESIWITHAHFDHFIGTAQIKQANKKFPQVVLHKDDLDLWRRGGEGSQIGIKMERFITPDLLISNNHKLTVGTHVFHALHTPGHTPGHVTYYSPEIPAAFCGDLIFHHSIGRTDLDGGNYQNLLHSIRRKILTLPPTTILYSGHGEPTTVAEEARYNPFLI